MSLNLDLLHALGKIPRGELRVLTALASGLVGTTQRAHDGWIAGRVVRLSDMPGIDASTALRKLRKRAREQGWRVRIMTAPLLGHFMEAAPDWPGLPNVVAKRMAAAGASAEASEDFTELPKPLKERAMRVNDPDYKGPPNMGYYLRREDKGRKPPSLVRIVRVKTGVYHEHVMATARDEVSGRILLWLVARGQRLGLAEGKVVFGPIDATPADAINPGEAPAEDV